VFCCAPPNGDAPPNVDAPPNADAPPKADAAPPPKVFYGYAKEDVT
jgi:hypothetical protein